MTENPNDVLSRSAFEESLVQAYPVVLNRLAARFNDPQLAEEVSVDSLAQAFEKWRTDPAYFRTHDLAAWSSRLAAWRALDRLRERTRHRPLPDEHHLDGDDFTPGPAVLPRRESASEALLRDREIMWNSLQKLSDEDRAILQGYYYDGSTDQELGTELFGPSPSTQANGLKVWRRRQRAHGRLREILVADGIDPADWSNPGGQAL